MIKFQLYRVLWSQGSLSYGFQSDAFDPSTKNVHLVFMKLNFVIIVVTNMYFSKVIKCFRCAVVSIDADLFTFSASVQTKDRIRPSSAIIQEVSPASCPRLAFSKNRLKTMESLEDRFQPVFVQKLWNRRRWIIRTRIAKHFEYWRGSQYWSRPFTFRAVAQTQQSLPRNKCPIA